MLEKISEKIVENLKKKDPEIKGDKEEIILFGVTRIVEDIPKFIGLILICYMLGILKEFVFVFLLNMLYKPFIGGAHARTNIGCFFGTVIYFLTPIYCTKILGFNNIFNLVIQIVLFVFGIFVIAKYAPADTEEIPIINKKQRKLLKTVAFVLFITINGIALVLNILNKNLDLANYLIYTTFFINIMTIKPIYKILGSRYGFLEYNEEGTL